MEQTDAFLSHPVRLYYLAAPLSSGERRELEDLNLLAGGAGEDPVPAA
jgi:hypothetical protein